MSNDGDRAVNFVGWIGLALLLIVWWQFRSNGNFITQIIFAAIGSALLAFIFAPSISSSSDRDEQEGEDWGCWSCRADTREYNEWASIAVGEDDGLLSFLTRCPNCGQLWHLFSRGRKPLDRNEALSRYPSADI